MNGFHHTLLDHQYRNSHLQNRIQDIDVDHRVVFSFESNAQLCDMTIDSVESRLLLVGSQDGHIYVFDVEDPSFFSLDSVKHTSIASVCNRSKSSRFLSKGSPLVCVQWYPVDSGSFTSASANKILGIWDTNRLECVTSVSFAQSLSWLSMSPVACSHNLIAVSLGPCSGESTGRAVLVDPLMGCTVTTLLGSHSQSGLTQVTWSPRAAYVVVTGGHDGRVLYWDIRFPTKPIYSLNRENDPQSDLGYSNEAIAHTGPVLGLKFSSDGLHLISWGGSGLTVNAASLRLWTSGPGDCEQSSHIPRLRPVNFGNIIFNSESNQISDAENQTFTSSNSSGSGNQSPQSSVLPIRLDTTHMSIGDLWGASSLCIFVPVRNRLLIASASKHNTSTKIITRHFSKIRACVWNDRRLELYTCGADGNLFTWPILPLSSSNVIDDDQF
ncbi:unnamed protein product [Schistosoma intercalatum]|nr:unnamed protein product [Schistosoma intercalatum]CAH8627412.1 unnamed protein product [Schistosoma intercalatum]